MNVAWTIAAAIPALFLPAAASGQLWYLTRGLSTDEVAWAADVDKAGYVYWAVEEKNAWPYWYYNIVLYKIDPAGGEVWRSAPWGGSYNEIAFKATVGDSLVYLSGRADSAATPVSGDALVAAFGTDDGNFRWAYTYNPWPDQGYEEIDGLLVQPDGIYLSGWKQQQGADDMDFLVQKISLSGQLLWTSTWDYSALGRFDGANGHMAMDAGFLYVAGHVNRTNIGSMDGDGALVCFRRSDGAYQWYVTWGGSLYDDALGMTMSADSMLYVVGYTGSFGNGSQVYLNKYSRSGQLLWNRIWGGAGTEDCRSAVTDGDSVIYVVGTTGSYGNGGKDIFVLKYDSAGTLLDSLLWGGPQDEVAKDVVRFGGYLYITGETKSFGNGAANGDYKTDGLLLKVDGRAMVSPDTATGALQWTVGKGRPLKVFPNPTNGPVSIRVGDARETRARVKIMDLSGRELFSAEQPLSGTPLRPDLEEGVYLLIVEYGNESAFEKLVVIR